MQISIGDVIGLVGLCAAVAAIATALVAQMFDRHMREQQRGLEESVRELSTTNARLDGEIRRAALENFCIAAALDEVFVEIERLRGTCHELGARGPSSRSWVTNGNLERRLMELGLLHRQLEMGRSAMRKAVYGMGDERTLAVMERVANLTRREGRTEYAEEVGQGCRILEADLRGQRDGRIRDVLRDICPD